MKISELLKKFNHAENKLILLDYDGTLVEFAPFPSLAKPSIRVCTILKKLAEVPGTKVVIITGREYNEIDRFLGHLPIDIVAEHGAMVKENGKWKSEGFDSQKWKKEILPFLQKISSDCKNSFIEEKNFSLAWHYRNADPVASYLYSIELIRETKKKSRTHGLRILEGNKVIEIMKKNTDKGKAVKKILKKTNYCYDFILSAGDDVTDDDMFKVLLNNKNYFTIKVGGGTSIAEHHLPKIKDVLLLLKSLCE